MRETHPPPLELMPKRRKARRNGMRQPTAVYTPEMLVVLLRAWRDLHGAVLAAKDWADSPDWPNVGTMRKHFGSWKAGLAAAGMAPRRDLGGGAPFKNAGPCETCGEQIEPGRSGRGRCVRCSAYRKRTGRDWTPGAWERWVFVDQPRLQWERFERVAELWNAGVPIAQIARQLDATKAAIFHLAVRARDAGFELPRRRAPAGRRYPRSRWYEVLLADPCAYCGAPSLHVDHIVARARGGENGPMNLTGACEWCNVSKGAKSLLVWMLGRGT